MMRKLPPIFNNPFFSFIPFSMKKLLLMMAIAIVVPFQFVFAEESYPINLLKNQKWKIEITAETNEYTNTQDILEVSRDGEKISTIAYQRDLKTGEKSKSNDWYRGGFMKKYTEPKDDYLELSHCWYKYEYIKEGFTCHHFRVPVEIKQKEVKGSESYESLMTGAYDNFDVIILEKDKKEIECNFKGETYQGQKLYYTKASNDFEEMDTFICFKKEADAKEADFRLNFAEGGETEVIEEEKETEKVEDNSAQKEEAEEAEVKKSESTEEEGTRESGQKFTPDFKDIRSNHKNYDAIGYVQHYKIVNGYPNGTFLASKKINRAELTKIIIESTTDQSEIYGDNCFSDVQNDWSAKYICTAKRKGIINGYPDNTFKPYQNISFVEAAKIISIAFQYQTSPDTEAWYRPFTIKLSEKNSIPETVDDIFKEITRGEMAEIIYRLKAGVTDKDNMQFQDGKLIRKTAQTNQAISEGLYEVTQVIDGDTIEVLMGNEEMRVRLIGIDTPEVKHPSKPQECFGIEASEAMKQFLKGKKVRLETDSSQGDKDKYNRFLRYVFLEDGTNINEAMIAEGYAKEYTYDTTYKYQKEFKEAEKKAQENNNGLWNTDNCPNEEKQSSENIDGFETHYRKWTINEVKVADKDSYLLTDANNKFLIVHLTNQNMTDETRTFSNVTVLLKDANGNEYNIETPIPSGKPELSAGVLEPDEKRSGWITFEIPKTLKTADLIFSSESDEGDVLRIKRTIQIPSSSQANDEDKVYSQNEKINFDEFDIEILNVYQMERIGSDSNPQYPKNKYFLVVEAQIKNTSNESRYFGDSVATVDDVQYQESVTVDVYGKYFFDYPSNSAVKLEAGASMKTYFGFDVGETKNRTATLILKPWASLSDTRAKIQLSTIKIVQEESLGNERQEESSSFGTCGSKTYCTEMRSCSEAKYFLNVCGLERLDSDHDGIPCESLCQ
jgi:micrococcal nuclease